MKAVVYREFATLPAVESVPDPAPRSHGVVLRVMATGLCRSDWHGWMGHDADITLPHVPGHEIAGTVDMWRVGSRWRYTASGKLRLEDPDRIHVV